MKELKKAVKSLADDAAGAEPAAADAGGAGGGAGALQGKAAARAKKADDYHARHPDWVAQFNALTGNECAGGPGGLKWAAVRAWQQKHWQANNLFSDGLVGPKTLEAAKIVAKKSAGTTEDEKQDATPKGNDGAADLHAGDGQKANVLSDDKQGQAHGGGAEAAEASAGKPNLEEAEADAATAEVLSGEKPADPTGKADPASKPEDKKAGTAEFENAVAEIEKLLEGFSKPPQNKAAAGKKDPKKPGNDDDGGMLSAKSLAGYQAAAQKVMGGWKTKTMEERCDELLAALNESLSAEQVYPLAGWKPSDVPELAGQFHPSSWTMDLGKRIFGNANASDAVQREAVSAVFHEGRHAYQRFEMARFLASRGKTDKQIVAETGISADVALAATVSAAQHPMATRGPEGKQVEALLDDAITHREEHEQTEHLAAQITAEGNRAKELFDQLSEEDKKNSKEKWQHLTKRMHMVLAARRNLPTEKDAEMAETQLGIAPPPK